MNIFYLSKSPKMAARYHCDKHVVKMILETAQLLSTAVHSIKIHDPELYKSTHQNHPSAVWVRSSKRHYEWALQLLRELCTEYTARYGKVHQTESKISVLEQYQKYFPNSAFKDPPLCMPEEYKSKNAVESYRNYYIGGKKSFATWKNGTPEWFKKSTT